MQRRSWSIDRSPASRELGRLLWMPQRCASPKLSERGPRASRLERLASCIIYCLSVFGVQSRQLMMLTPTATATQPQAEARGSAAGSDDDRLHCGRRQECKFTIDRITPVYGCHTPIHIPSLHPKQERTPLPGVVRARAGPVPLPLPRARRA